MPRTSAKPKTGSRKVNRASAVPTGKKKPIEQYDHKGKERVNNPPVGLVRADTDQESTRKTYAYDPHLDPQLMWAGKAEHTSFEVPTVSLHVHERIDPRSIIEAVRKVDEFDAWQQMSLFQTKTENPPLREAIEFYKHRHNWSNRLIAGDSLLVMNSLLEKEGMAGQVQMVYLDPPYGVKYGSNFQPFVNKRNVTDGKDDDLNQEPEMIKAFRDTWELGIHSYLTYLRDRLLLARDLLHESGSVFVQISDENIHRVRSIMDEIFGSNNFVALITVVKTSGLSSPSASTLTLASTADYLLWYAADIAHIKYYQLYRSKASAKSRAGVLRYIELPDGTRRTLSQEELSSGNIPEDGKLYSLGDITAQKPTTVYDFEYQGQVFHPGKRGWRTTKEGMQQLAKTKRIVVVGDNLRYVQYESDFPVMPLNSVWEDTGTGSFLEPKIYVVQTGDKVIERCILMTTDPGDLVIDPTCGSGTTAYIAEQWGRRWITCDTSRVAITLAKQRLMTSVFDYYHLAQPDEGVDSGFRYKTVPHVTLKSIAHSEPPEPETLYDQPLLDNSRNRVTGPFTVEAVPAPSVRPLSVLSPVETGASEMSADESVARSGETLRQSEWRDELYRTGIRGKGGQKIEFTRVEPLPGTRWLHADAETRPSPAGRGDGGEGKPQRVAVSFGPEFAPLEQRQVELALEEAQTLVPRPKLIVFASFQFDPEAAKDIDETTWPGVTLLKAQMNTDLLTEDLKKKRASNESFWLIGQPDVTLTKIKHPERTLSEAKRKSKDAGRSRSSTASLPDSAQSATDLYQVEVHGFDYYNTRTGSIESGGQHQIAVWLLDPDYDGRSLFPRQVFFPMSSEKDGWSKLTRNLKAEIDEELIEAYRGTVSLPFAAGRYKRAAVKIVDDRGIESLKIIEVG